MDEKISYTFERMYADEPDKWFPISEESAREKLAQYFQNVDDVLYYLLNSEGAVVRTPWAFYRKTQS